MSGSVFSNVLGMKRTLLLCCQFMLACTGAATEDARDDGSSDDGDAQNGGGEGGASDGEGGTGGRGEDDTQVSLGGTSWRRLTSDQLNNTLVDLFGPGM